MILLALLVGLLGGVLLLVGISVMMLVHVPDDIQRQFAEHLPWAVDPVRTFAVIICFIGSILVLAALALVSKS